MKKRFLIKAVAIAISFTFIVGIGRAVLADGVDPSGSAGITVSPSSSTVSPLPPSDTSGSVQSSSAAKVAECAILWSIFAIGLVAIIATASASHKKTNK